MLFSHRKISFYWNFATESWKNCCFHRCTHKYQHAGPRAATHACKTNKPSFAYNAFRASLKPLLPYFKWCCQAFLRLADSSLLWAKRKFIQNSRDCLSIYWGDWFSNTFAIWRFDPARSRPPPPARNVGGAEFPEGEPSRAIMGFAIAICGNHYIEGHRHMKSTVHITVWQVNISVHIGIEMDWLFTAVKDVTVRQAWHRSMAIQSVATEGADLQLNFRPRVQRVGSKRTNL